MSVFWGHGIHFSLKLLLVKMSEHNQDEENQRVRTFMLSDFQVQCIQDYFNHFDWDLKEIETERNDVLLMVNSDEAAVSSGSASNDDHPSLSLVQENPQAQNNDTDNDDHIQVNHAGNNDEDVCFSDDEEEQCPDCFLKPCTSNGLEMDRFLGNKIIRFGRSGIRNSGE